MARATSSVSCGKHTPIGRRDSSRRRSTFGAGMPTGRRPATRTRRSRSGSAGNRRCPWRKPYVVTSRVAGKGPIVLKVAIVGCGKIADAHASQIQRLRGCEIVGLCDREELMARQLAERFHIRRSFRDLKELIDEVRPDVVHITTPPQSHFGLAKRCLEEGCHVYVEKPFTLHRKEAEELIALAESRRLKLTAGHDDQFRHAARRMRQLLRDGYLGGAPVHMESYYGYEEL